MKEEFLKEHVTVEKKHPDGSTFTLSKSDLLTKAIQKRADWTPAEIDEVWENLKAFDCPIRDWYKFCEGLIDKKRQINYIEKLQTKEPACQNIQVNSSREKKPSETINSISSGKDSLVLAFPNWKSGKTLKEKLSVTQISPVE